MRDSLARSARARAIAMALGLSIAPAVVLVPTALRAQDLALKRAIAGAETPCAPAPTTAPTPTASLSRGTDDAEARRLAAAGYEAEILGDFRTARDTFVRATAFLPRDDRLAYHLARAHEALDEYEAAARAYCRTLAVAPAGPNAGDSRLRLRALMAGGHVATSGPSTHVRASFATAVAAVDAHALDRADDAFSRAVQDAPSLAEGWYDRGVVRIALGRSADAVRDLERYLTLRPDAPDAPAVRARIERLRHPSFSPSAALVQGLVVPGLGQLYTRRPVNGLVVLIVAGGATAWALDSREEIRERTFVDAFGFPYTGRETVRVRPHLAQGLAIAGTAAIGAAIESWYYARRSSHSPRTLGLMLRPDLFSRALALRVTIAR